MLVDGTHSTPWLICVSFLLCAVHKFNPRFVLIDHRESLQTRKEPDPPQRQQGQADHDQGKAEH
ncbi:hypothetical protein, partial [Propionivibrio sp.]|uniref:hypothetical protein n=1 Tax=Propionivibrio sp. TaxID=2212460 RepID=UPI0025E5DE7B